MNVRYKLTPQMVEYDRVGHTWAPYLMYFHTANYSSHVVNTDSRGFRIVYKNSCKISDFRDIDNQPVSLIVGNSAAFGIGATNDARAVPSILNSITDRTWLNFGGRAFSSTQEFLLFIFNYHFIPRIDKVVILSGVNNLVLRYLSSNYLREAGSFFFWNHYNHIMNKTRKMSIRRKILRSAIEFIYKSEIEEDCITKKELWRGSLARLRGNNSLKDSPDPDKHKDDLLYVLRRDIHNWKLIAQTLGFELYYVLQPVANWVRKEKSEEEKMLFSELDSCQHNQSRVLRDCLNNLQYTWFLKSLEGICRDYGIKFFDMNNGLSVKENDGRWLFVDRIHLTDAGYEIIATILKERVICE